MFCFKCGAEISDESDFCMKCGTEILHHNKTEIEEVNSISTIPMNATIKSAFVSTIIVSETEISYKSGLKKLDQGLRQRAGLDVFLLLLWRVAPQHYRKILFTDASDLGESCFRAKAASQVVPQSSLHGQAPLQKRIYWSPRLPWRLPQIFRNR